MSFSKRLTNLVVLAATTIGAGMVGVSVLHAQDQTVVKYWTFLPYGGERPRERGETAIIDAFMKENPGIKIEVEVLPSGEIHKKFLATFASGNGPDVLRVEPSIFPVLIKASALRPLEEYLADWKVETRNDFFDWNGTVVDGQKMVLPIAANVFTLLYRKDLFAEKGLQPPKSWSDMVDVAKALTTEDRWGFAYALGREGAYAQALIPPFVWGAGGEILGKDGKATFNDEHGAAAFSYLYDLAHTHKVAPTEVTTFNLEDVMQGFMAGKYAMIIDGANRYSTIQGSDTVKGKVGIAHIPSQTGEKPAPSYSTGGWMLGLNAKSEKAEAGAKFIKFYAGKEAQTILAEVAGDFPALKSVFDAPFMSAPDRAYLKEFADILSTSSGGPLLSDRFSQLMGVALIPAAQEIFGGADVKASLDAAAARFNE